MPTAASSGGETIMTVRLGLVGLGQIARSQHLPAIAATPGMELAAVASPGAQLDGVPCYPDIETMIASEADLDAVTLCTPPSGRFDQVRVALAAGKHVMLEKPPCATLSEAHALREMAAAAGLSLFTTWHSRRAAAVGAVRALLASRAIRRVEIVWREDVRRWHPGQAWIWQPGGLGVFDPGINALSIVTHILPQPVFVRASDLWVPANRQTPIAARLSLATADGTPVTADLDWRATEDEAWDISIETDDGRAVLADGGSRLIWNEEVVAEGNDREYLSLYADFAGLINRRDSDADMAPLTLVADALLMGRHHASDPFH
jgi:D-galactose 1-dehydrogenase